MEFPDGVVGIIGPNGAGKSTLIEAISWALYGNKSEIVRDGKDGIKRSGAGPNEDCCVQLVFELGGAQYQLKRSMRGKDLKVEAELLANGEVLASSEKSVTAQVEKVLGMDHRAFFISVFARQKELSALSALSPAERKKLIVRMLELDVLQKVIDEIRRDERDEKTALQFVNEQLLAADRRPKREVLSEELSSLNGELEELRTSLDRANAEAARLEQEMEKARGHKDWVALKEEEYRKQERRLMDKRKELEELRAREAVVDRDLQALKVKLADLPNLEARRSEYEDLLRRKEEMESEVRGHEERKAAQASLQRAEDELGKAEASLQHMRAERSKLRNPQESLSTVTKNLEALEDSIGSRKERISSLDAQTRSMRAEIEEMARRQSDVQSLGPDSMCPTCERQLGEHHHYLLSKLLKQSHEKAVALKPLADELAQLRTDLDTEQKRRAALDDRKKKLQTEVIQEQRLDAAIEQAQASVASLVEQRDQLARRLQELGEGGFDEKAYQELRSRLPALKVAAERCQALSGEGARLPELEARKDEAAQSIRLREGELKTVQSDLALIGYQEGDLRKAQAAYEAALRSREAGYNEVSRKVDAIEHLQERIADKERLLQEVVEMEKGVQGRTKRVEELATLDRVMADFKQNVMERIVPTLSEVSSDLFAAMTDSKYGGIELDEDYEMQIYDGGEKFPLGRFSGGEGDLANLCLRLAISRVLADRSGNDINFLILDEIFGSQDQVRKRNIMNTLNNLEKQFHQIILITHIDDTKDFMSNVLTIKELEDGTSTVEL